MSREHFTFSHPKVPKIKTYPSFFIANLKSDDMDFELNQTVTLDDIVVILRLNYLPQEKFYKRFVVES